MKKTLNVLLGILTGAVNILIGSCGGIVAVEALKLLIQADRSAGK